MAVLSAVTEDDFQNKTLAPIATLKNIRIEPSSKLITTKDNRSITLLATLFFDCVNSSPQTVAFATGQKITLGNNLTYTIETIEPLYDECKLHHYELGLA